MADVFAGLYATDEKLAERYGLDWVNAAPRLLKVAYGVDGNFSSSARWVFKSSACDFSANGLQAGHVLYLHRQASTGVPEFREVFGVASVGGEASAPYSVTLKRAGEDAGFGEPPGPVSGTLTGVSFTCWSAIAHIRNYTREIRNKYGLSSTDTLDAIEAASGPAELIEAYCVAKSSRWIFFYKEPAYRHGTTGSGQGGGAGVLTGDFGEKSKALVDEIKEYEKQLDDWYASPIAGSRVISGSLPSPDPTPNTGLPDELDTRGWGEFPGGVRTRVNWPGPWG